MTEPKKCECPIMPRVELLEQHMFGHRESNTHGVHPAMFGDGDEKQGVIGVLREVRWLLRIVLAGIGIVLAVIIGKWAEQKSSVPMQSVNQSISTGIGEDAKPPIYTTPQVAKMLQLSDREIQDRASKGEIPGAWKDGKAWRFDAPSVDAFIAANAATAVSVAPADNATKQN